MTTRRAMMRRSLLLLSGMGVSALASAAPRRLLHSGTRALPPLIEDVEQRTFNWFRDVTNTANGLVPDRWPTPSFASIAAVGFGLTALPIGVERGWMTRAEARARVLTTLRFFWNAPQGPQAEGVSGYKGFFYHFLDMQTGLRYKQVELSTIDTTLLLGGILFCAQYFGRAHADEAEIRRLADAIYARVDWRWAQARGPLIALGWHPERGFIDADWRGYNEAMLLYILAIGAPVHGIAADAWESWCASYPRYWGESQGYTFLRFPALFIHQYSHVWIDFRGIADPYMRAKGMDYFENSRRATLAQRRYAIENPRGWKGYGPDIWGLTACDGPADVERGYHGEQRAFAGYSARGEEGPDARDDGTLAPTAALGSIAFAPGESIAAAKAMHANYSTDIYGKYGFFDAFNPSFDYADVALQTGHISKGAGWVASDYLGIDQGPILAGIENYRSGLVWRYMRAHPAIRAGLLRAGFTGGWLA